MTGNSFNLGIVAIVYIVIINIVAFAMYGADKKKARKHKWRIPEAYLIGIAVVGGSLGAFAGMKIFHHKTKHIKFFVGIPLIILLQIVALAYVNF